MGKKRIILLFFAVIFAFLAFWLMDYNSQTDTAPSGALRWVREKSSCTDISIQNDRVVLTYSLHFENTTDDDCWVCYPQASFRRYELWGWMECGNFSGYGENGENTFLIPANQAVDIIIIFEGKYLGGPVNENISLPSLVFMIKDSEDFS